MKDKIKIEPEIKTLRKSCSMSQKDFAGYFGIPLRTLQHWESGDRSCPKYLLDLMAYKAKKESKINS